MSSQSAAASAEAKSLLIVDDERDIRETLQEAFEEEGYSVAIAANGAEALEKVRQTRPCAIILDMIMPVMTGEQFYNTLQADPDLAGIPVIVSTSDPLRAPPGVLLMRKPLDLDRLISAVARICE